MNYNFTDKRVGNIIEMKSGYTWSSDQETNSPKENSVRVLTVTNIQKTLDKTYKLYLNNVSEKDKEEKKVTKGWTIAVGSNGNRNRIGNCVYIDEDTEYLFASFLVGFKPKDISGVLPEYFFRWMSSEIIQRKISTTSEGTTGLGNFNTRYFKKLKMSFPEDIEIQKHITEILTAVDYLIVAIQNSIEKAERLRKSLMQNLLTGKLKPDGTLRKEDEFDKTDYIKIPKNWKTYGFGPQGLGELNPQIKFIKNKEYDFIDMDGVGENYSGIKNISRRIINDGSFSRFINNDILIAKITPCLENGKIAIAQNINSEIGFGSTEFIVIRASEKIYFKYLYYLLSSNPIHSRAVSLMEGTTGRQRVPLSAFKKKIKVAIPCDIEEQKEIVNQLDNVQSEIEKRKSKINILNILKKSLLQNLLTGKVKIKPN